MVQGNTEKEARDFFDYYVHQKGDWVAATNLVETMGIAAQTLPPETLRSMKAHFIAGWGGYPLVGTNEQIVEGWGGSRRWGSMARCSRGRAISRACGNSSRRSCRSPDRPGFVEDARQVNFDVRENFGEERFGNV